MENLVCNVVGCRYIADAVITECGDFPVCTLHDGPQVRKILDQLQRPGAFTYDGRPIVVPCGDLSEADMVKRPVEEWNCEVGADGRLDDLPPGPCIVHPDFCLVCAVMSDPSGT